MSNKDQGFTLVELLVVISIIAILATIGMVMYLGLQTRARDGKRQADLRVIQGALQQYYADNNFFPLNLNLLTSPVVYLKALPVDPSSLNDYRYDPIGASGAVCNNTSTKCITYCLGTTLENTANAPTSLCTPSIGNYGITPP